MKYDEAYIHSKDIDWFCIIGGVFCHIASAGGLLPDIVNDREKLRDLQKRVFESDYIFEEEEIVVNRAFLNQQFGYNQEAQSDYLASFVSMARKGFISFDRTNVMDLSDQIYHIVCYPQNPLVLQNFQDLCKVEGDVLHNGLSNIQLLDLFE